MLILFIYFVYRYVYICQELAAKRSLPTEVYVNEIVPNLFSLAWDPVPNVRLAVARCLGLTLLPLGEYLMGSEINSIFKIEIVLLLVLCYDRLQYEVEAVPAFVHKSMRDLI